MESCFLFKPKFDITGSTVINHNDLYKYYQLLCQNFNKNIYF